jgi:hypothetical protein
MKDYFTEEIESKSRDYFAEEIESKSRDYFAEEIEKKEKPPLRERIRSTLGIPEWFDIRELGYNIARDIPAVIAELPLFEQPTETGRKLAERRAEIETRRAIKEAEKEAFIGPQPKESWTKSRLMEELGEIPFLGVIPRTITAPKETWYEHPLPSAIELGALIAPFRGGVKRARAVREIPEIEIPPEAPPSPKPRRVKIGGEWYEAKPSPETGEVRLVDGKDITLDIFDRMPVEDLKIAKAKPSKPAPAVAVGDRVINTKSGGLGTVLSVKPTGSIVIRGDVDGRTGVLRKGEFSKVAKPAPEPVRAFAKKAEVPTMPEPGAIEGKLAKVQDLPSIVEGLSKDLDVPIKVGYYRAKRGAKLATGIYKEKPEVIRIKTANDLSSISHETAHHIDKKFAFTKEIKKNPELAEEMRKLDYEPEKARIEEGFAEFVRHWMTDETAPDVAPKTFGWFEDYIKRNPELYRALPKAKNSILRWRAQGVDARIEGAIARKPRLLPQGVGEAARDAWTEFRMAIDEPLEPLKKFTQKAEKKLGKPLLEEENPYLVANAVWKRGGLKALQWENVARTDFDGNVIGPSLRDILKPVAKDADRAIHYAFCKHALERWREGKNPGISKADAEMYIEKYQSPEFDNFVKEFTAYSNDGLNYVVESGGFSPETAQLFRDTYQNYVPLFREKPKTRFLGGKGKGFADLPTPFKRAIGGGERVLDLVTNVRLQTEKLISWADRARVNRLIRDLVIKAGGMGEWMDKVEIPATGKKIKTAEVIKALEREGIEISKMAPDELLTTMNETMTFWSTQNRGIPKDNIVTFFDKAGKPEAWQLKPQFYRSLKMMDGLQMPMALRIATWPFAMGKKAVALGATGLRFSFGWGTNFFRDPWVYYLQSQYPKAQPLRGFGSTFKVVKNKLGWNPGESWRLFQSLGGEWGTFFNTELPRAMRRSRRLIKDARHSEALNVIRHPFELYREVVNIPELGPRFREFRDIYNMRLKETGSHRSAWIAAMNAQWEVSVPFGRYGYVLEAANRFIPFIGPWGAGWSMFFRRFRTNPIRTTTRGLAITSASLALWNQNKDKDWYKSLPDWDKYGFWHFNLGDDEKPRIFRLPKPFEWGLVFASAPEAVANRMFAEDPDAMKELYGRAWEYILPPTAPALIGPMISLSRGETGYDPFRKRPIVPFWETQVLPPEARYGRYTTETAKGLGKLLKVSPRKIDYGIGAMTGGGGLDVIRGVEGLIKPSVEPKETEDYPYIGRFLSRSPWINAFYDHYEKIEDAQQRWKQLTGDEKREFQKQNRKLLVQRKTFQNISKQMSEQRKQIKKIKESNKSPEEKRRAIKKRDERIEELARKALKLVK